MKIQCNCGTKYAFDVTEEMLAKPVQFICQNCGSDNSAVVNQIIQQQFGSVPAVPAEAPPVSPAEAPPVISAPPPVSGSRLKVNVGGGSAPAATAARVPAAAQKCVKHPWENVHEQCVVCHKPLCPKCMEMFGYVCSPLCKGEAESRGIEVPVYARQASAVQAAGWRHFRLVGWSIAVGIVALIGLYSWYSFYLSKPKPVFSVRFDEAADHGNARFVTAKDAIVLRGGRLIRYDLKGKKELWHSDLVDKEAVRREAAKEAAEQQETYEKLKTDRVRNLTDSELRKYTPHKEEDIARSLETQAGDEMRLHVRDKNVWVQSPDKLVRYDYDSGKAAQEVPLGSRYVHRTIAGQDSLVLFSAGQNGETITRVNLTSGQSDKQEMAAAAPKPAALGSAGSNNLSGAAVAQTKMTKGGAVAIKASTTSAKTPAVGVGGLSAGTTAVRGGTAQPGLQQFKTRRDPSYAEKIAAPALAANQVNNARLNEAMADDDEPVAAARVDYGGRTAMDASGKFVQVSAKLLEHKIIQRQAMKAAPSKSALDGDVNQASTVAVANEILNEFQRDRTGGIEEEDVSRYEVSIKPFGSEAAVWTGETIGLPEFYALKSVNLVVAGKTVHVFDQNFRKVWESKLNYAVGGSPDLEDDFFGSDAGCPAVEKDKYLYFRDEGVLTCFDLASGNARWRLPSVGVTRILFDAKGMLYAETTTASADKLKFSQQVDVSRKDHPLIIKVDPANGTLLWGSENNGKLAHIEGKFIYTLEWQGGVETGEENPYGVPGAYTPPHVRIRRLSPKTGKVEWEHYQRRGPLDVRFQGNNIEILFRKEFQVLSFASL